MILGFFGKKKKDDVKKDSGENKAVVVNDDVKTKSAGDEPKKKKGLGAKMKEAAMKKMMEKQLKQLPPEQREVVMKAVMGNPEFFENIAKEIEVETKKGASQMAASMKVMRKHQGQLQKIMTGSK